MTSVVAIMMLITGALILRREHTKLCILHFCCEHRKKEYWRKKKRKRKKRYMTAVFPASVHISVLLHVFQKSWTVDPLLRRAIFKNRHPAHHHHHHHPRFHIQRSIVGSCCHLRPVPRPSMCFAYTRPLGVDPTQPAGPGERGRSASAGGARGGDGGCVGMRGWSGGRVTLLPH